VRDTKYIYLLLNTAIDSTREEMRVTLAISLQLMVSVVHEDLPCKLLEVVFFRNTRNLLFPPSILRILGRVREEPDPCRFVFLAPFDKPCSASTEQRVSFPADLGDLGSRCRSRWPRLRGHWQSFSFPLVRGTLGGWQWIRHGVYTVAGPDGSDGRQRERWGGGLCVRGCLPSESQSWPKIGA
jgi:hypothetical protein